MTYYYINTIQLHNKLCWCEGDGYSTNLFMGIPLLSTVGLGDHWFFFFSPVFMTFCSQPKLLKSNYGVKLWCIWMLWIEIPFEKQGSPVTWGFSMDFTKSFCIFIFKSFTRKYFLILFFIDLPSNRRKILYQMFLLYSPMVLE